MKRYIKIFAALILFAIAATLPAAAQGKGHNKEDREEWFRQLREFKHEYLAKELGLSAEQQKLFFPIYDTMSTERRDARRKLRHAEHELKKKGKAATEADYENVARMQLELKGVENDIETRYYPQFKKTLTAKQLVELKNVETKFAELVRKYYHEKKDKKPKGK